jgi:hypothetical protein
MITTRLHFRFARLIASATEELRLADSSLSRQQNDCHLLETFGVIKGKRDTIQVGICYV